jgi:hypothetical protein
VAARDNRAGMLAPRRPIVSLRPCPDSGVRLRYPVPRDRALRSGPDSCTKVAPSRRTPLTVRITGGNARGSSQHQSGRGTGLRLVTHRNQRSGFGRSRGYRSVALEDTTCPVSGPSEWHPHHTFAHGVRAFLLTFGPPTRQRLWPIHTLFRVMATTRGRQCHPSFEAGVSPINRSRTMPSSYCR